MICQALISMKIVISLFLIFTESFVFQVNTEKAFKPSVLSPVNFPILNAKILTDQHKRMGLNDYKEYFNLSYDQFIKENNIQSSQIHKDVSYEKLTNVTRVNMPDGHDFYFKDGKLKLIYTSDETLTKKLWNEFESITNTNTPEKTVRSRAGKTANQLIFAAQGITVSITKDEVHFIEIYPPCSLEYYIEHIYKEPQPFIR